MGIYMLLARNIYTDIYTLAGSSTYALRFVSYRLITWRLGYKAQGVSLYAPHFVASVSIIIAKLRIAIYAFIAMTA